MAGWPTTSRVCALALGVCAMLTGCDDVLIFDVNGAGQVLVAAQADGLTPLAGDAKKPRHLFLIDPETGDTERLTSSPLKLAWPRFCGEGYVFVEDRAKLVLLTAREKKTLLTSETNLFQPVVSPDAGRVLVLEADRLGVSGRLLVLEVSTGKVTARVENALLGANWSDDGRVLAAVSRHPRTEPFEAGDGAILEIDGERRRALFKGTIPPVTVVSRGADGRVICVLPLEAEDGPLGLATLVMGKPGARRGETGVFDFWPSLSKDGQQVLFTRTQVKEPKLQGQLRVASLTQIASSRPVTTSTPAAAPRWVSEDRVAYVTHEDHLVIQDLDGRNRLDASASLKAAFGPEPQ